MTADMSQPIPKVSEQLGIPITFAVMRQLLDNRMRRLHREGVSMRAIAAQLGCSVGTVQRWLSTHKRQEAKS